jgi:hypothetical protein
MRWGTRGQVCVGGRAFEAFQGVLGLGIIPEDGRPFAQPFNALSLSKMMPAFYIYKNIDTK